MKTALVIGGTKKDIDAMGTLAVNIKDVCPGIADEIVVFHDGIRKKEQEKFNSIFPARFIRYKCPVNFIRLMLNETIRYFSPMVFCKFECFRLLEEYDTVIWTDYDILIKENIEELLTREGNFLTLVNEDVPLKNMFYRTIDKINMGHINMNGECVCAPLFVLRREVGDYKKYYEWCYVMTRKYLRHLYLPEQCIITMLTQEFDIPYTVLEEAIYCMHPREELPETKILHAYGQPKFWSGLENKNWNKYNRIWKGKHEEVE